MLLCFGLCVWYVWVKYKKVVWSPDRIFHVGSKFWCIAKVQDRSSWHPKYILLEINKILFCIMLQLHSNYSKQMEIRTAGNFKWSELFFVICLLCTSSLNWSHQKLAGLFSERLSACTLWIPVRLFIKSKRKWTH